MIRVLVVEDSPTSRLLLINYLDAEIDIEVIAAAENGLEAVRKTEELKPDIIVMDINMPKMNGFEATQKIMEENPTPILLVSSDWNMSDVKIALKSMGIGALGALEKPTGPGYPKFKKHLDDLIEHIRIMSQIKVVRRWKKKSSKDVYNNVKQVNISNRVCKIIVIGASTGGPPVLSEILRELPADYPMPILIVQHMSDGFMDHFISWLNGHCLINVKKAVNGEIIKPGNIYFGSEEHHITIDRGRIKFSLPIVGDTFVPSVSRLFSSVAENYAKETVAIILSGMGRDGAIETKMLKDRGALTIAQDEASSVVFGMAKEAIKLDAIDMILSPQEIKEALLKLIVIKDKI
jgi:two-component system chemotaxis response regulator CheB